MGVDLADDVDSASGVANDDVLTPDLSHMKTPPSDFALQDLGRRILVHRSDTSANDIAGFHLSGFEYLIDPPHAPGYLLLGHTCLFTHGLRATMHWYTFARISQAVRMASAMAVSISDRLRSIAEFVKQSDDAALKPGLRGPYRRRGVRNVEATA